MHRRLDLARRAVEISPKHTLLYLMRRIRRRPRLGCTQADASGAAGPGSRVQRWSA